jgi:hypothetical protein
MLLVEPICESIVIGEYLSNTIYMSGLILEIESWFVIVFRVV